MTTETPKPADAAPNGAGGGSAAGAADLESLLGEFQAKPDKQPNVADVLKNLAPVITFAETELTNRAESAFKKDISDAISFVKEEEAIKVLPDTVVRGFLEGRGAEDESFKKAFQNRAKDPATWQAKLSEARTAFAAEVKPSSNARIPSDVLAARAAVSGQTPQPPDTSKHDATALFAMSEQEYRRYLSGLPTAAR